VNEILRATDRPPQPWRNGGGVTWQVASSPRGATVDDFDWRISIAEIAQDGEFSRYPGVERVIAVIDGPGVYLDVDGATHLLEPFAPLRFPGSARTSSRLRGGTTRDLNLMVRASGPSGSIEFVRVGTEPVVVDGDCVVLVAGNAAVSGTATGEAQPLSRYDAVLADAPLHVRGPGAVLALVRTG
jgi:environmental stress-induced protein Ves